MLYEPDTRFLVMAALALGGWYSILAGLALVRWPKTPEAGPPTNDLPPESPAVANLLTNGWLVNEEALPATLLDLAARGFLTIEDRGDAVFVCRLQQDASGPLRDYEKRVLDHLRRLQRGGVVPAGALTTGMKEESKKWWKSFRKEVSSDARSSGLAGAFWPLRLSVILFALGVPIYFLIARAQGFKDADEVKMTAFLMIDTYAMWAGVGLLLILTNTARLRDTQAGRVAAARWLGVKKNLKTLPSFPDLPPTAVTTWERHLAYGAALGVAGRVVRTLPLGAERDRRAWTHYGGGWRLVQVRYPRFRPGWGTKPWIALLGGLLRVTVALVILRLALDGGVFSGSLLPENPPWWAPPITWFVGLAVMAIAVWSAVGLGWALLDLGPPSYVEGEVLRTRLKGRYVGSGSDESKQLYFVAVYPGRGNKVLAWRVEAKKYGSFAQGLVVRAEVTPRLRYVKSVEWIRS